MELISKVCVRSLFQQLRLSVARMSGPRQCLRHNAMAVARSRPCADVLEIALCVGLERSVSNMFLPVCSMCSSQAERTSSSDAGAGCACFQVCECLGLGALVDDAVGLELNALHVPLEAPLMPCSGPRCSSAAGALSSVVHAHWLSRAAIRKRATGWTTRITHDSHHRACACACARAFAVVV